MRHLRRSHEISLHLLAQRTGINVSMLSMMERRLKEGTPEQRKIVAKVFKCSEEALLQDAPQVVA